jgi:hypothetical protein
MNENILKIPYSAVNYDWNFLQKFLELKGNPKYIIVGYVDLRGSQDIFDLGNLVGVEGNFDLGWSSIETLSELTFVDGYFNLNDCENITTLGKLKKVGDFLDLGFSSIESLGELEYVGGDLYVYNTNIPQIELNNVEVGGDIIR